MRYVVGRGGGSEAGGAGTSADVARTKTPGTGTGRKGTQASGERDPANKRQTLEGEDAANLSDITRTEDSEEVE